MSVQYVDYYKVLGVTPAATHDEIQKAYRKLARRYHPDISTEPDAEERFKQIGEAYEILKDPTTRSHYDRIGTNHGPGQNVEPPPGWRPDLQDLGGFSDFFQAFFGQNGRGFRHEVRLDDEWLPDGAWPRTRHDHRAVVEVELRDAYHGATREITVQRQEPAPNGGWETRSRKYTVRIPPGVTSGKVLRLAGQGQQGVGGAADGDLLLEIRVAKDPVFDLQGHDLYVSLELEPWQAVLGCESVDVPTLDRTARMKVPAGVQPGQKLRLRGKGLPKPKGPRGNLFARIRIRIPTNPTQQERQLYEQLALLRSPS